MVINLPTPLRADRIRELHFGIEEKLRSAVTDAIEIGQLLFEQKAELAHGEWLPWLRVNVGFSERTAQNYLRVFEHRDKTASVADLTQAYRMVEDLEAQQRREVKAKVEEHRAEGTAPPKADRPVYEEFRRQKHAETVQARATEILEEQRREPPKAEPDPYLEYLEERLSEGPDIGMSNLTEDLSQDTAIGVIRKYLGTLENDNRRLQTIHNLIKWLRDEGTRLQRASA